MLVVSDLSSDLTVKELIKIWSERYKLKIRHTGGYAVIQSATIFDALVQSASLEGRRATAAKLHRLLIKLNCEFAETQTREFHKYASSQNSQSEAKRIVQCAVEIYVTLLEFYQELPQELSSDPIQTSQESEGKHDSSLASLEIVDIVKLSNLLEPLLLEYQDRHQVSTDWSKLGFLTTHLNFSNMALLKNLTAAEQFLIKPYFKFLEERLALPWQRICGAASIHQYNSPAFQLVRHLMPEAEEIAYRVYINLLKQFPQTVMRRGRLDHPDVKYSCIRDLNMFQAYLWLCVLEGSLAPVEDELVRLCTMVLPRIGIPWEMTVQSNKLLMAELMDRTRLNYQTFLEPYMIRFMQTFSQSRDQLAAEF